MKTLVFGASSAVGKVYCKLNPEAVQLTSEDCNLYRYDDVSIFVRTKLGDEPVNVVMFSVVNKQTLCNETSYIQNVKIASNMAYFFRERANHFIFTSSVDVYGNKDRINTSVEDECAPDNWYGKAKLISEKIIQDLIPSSVILRLCGVWGTGTGLLDKNELNLNNNGDTLRHFIHAEDLCNIINIMIKSGERGVFNAVSPRFQSMKEWCLSREIKTNISPLKTERDFDLIFNTEKLDNAIDNYQWKYP